MTKIAICTPIGRAGNPHFHTSLDQTLFSCPDGYQIGAVQDVGHANTPRIRNVLAQKAIDHGFDVIVFIDDDISWNVADFWAIIDDPAPIVGIPPRKRTDDLNEIVFGCGLREKIEDGRWYGRVATAFMKIEVSALRKLEPHTDWFNYVGAMGDENPEGVVRVWFDYEVGMNPGGSRGYIGEDYWFCQFAEKHGIEPVVRTDLGVFHWHTVPLGGRVDDYQS